MHELLRVGGDCRVLRHYGTEEAHSSATLKGNQQNGNCKIGSPQGCKTVEESQGRKGIQACSESACKKAAVSTTAKAIAKISASIAKLIERKNKIAVEINALRDQRTALNVVPATAPAAVVAAPAKAKKGAAKK